MVIDHLNHLTRKQNEVINFFKVERTNGREERCRQTARPRRSTRVHKRRMVHERRGRHSLQRHHRSNELGSQVNVMDAITLINSRN